MSFTGKEGEPISLTTASAWTANYRTANPGEIVAHFFGKNILQDILAQTGCVGIRFYYALDDTGVKQLVIVGANSSENDLYNGIVGDRSSNCESCCDTNGSPLM